jgi:hypothetical protein
MGGIGEPAVSEGIGCEEVAELVVETGLGDAEDGDECGADHNNAETNQQHGEALAAGQASAGALQGEKNCGSSGAFSGRNENQYARGGEE